MYIRHYYCTQNMYMMLKYEPVLIYLLFIIMQITSLHQIAGFSISIFFSHSSLKLIYYFVVIGHLHYLLAAVFLILTAINVCLDCTMLMNY